MARGGHRPGAGRKPGVKPPPLADRKCASRLLDALNEPGEKQEPYEVAQWRALTEAQDLRVRLDARKYLYDKRDGRAVQPMHIDPPAEIVIDIPAAVSRSARESRNPRKHANH